MPIEHEHLDVLQNIEFTVVKLFRKHREMSDYDVQRVYEDLLADYTSEQKESPPKKHKQSPLETQLYDDIRTICEWRLGRAALPTEDEAPTVELIDITILIRCFKRLIKSLNTWNKNAGRQGYLSYISEFMP